MTKRPSFSFVLVKMSPENADPLDPIWRYTVPYMRFRHPDVQARHWVLCVRDALAIMDSAVAPAGVTIGEIHVYAHANEVGSVWGRLQSTNEPYRALSLDDIKKFRLADRKVQAVAAKTDRHTRLYFHGCNLGKSPTALMNWRDAFGVTRGFASAPDLFQHFCAGPLQLRATCPGAKTLFFERDIFGMADIEHYITDVVAAAPVQCGKMHPDFAALFRKLVFSDLDTYLYKMFEKLKRGAEIPWPDVATVSKATAIERMRALFEQAKGVPFTFLAQRLLSGPVLGNACDEEKLRHTHGLGVVFPWQAAQWKNHHHWEPHSPPEAAL
ncbi:MAG: hypothetical protein BroJett021_26000 [Chloroflexota bacterium]|nr:hypothetical protein [Caldilinea sp.]GIK73612.1 MAG: hypothetical protein BroJett021_26000 [Chloroflexota bacterium]